MSSTSDSSPSPSRRGASLLRADNGAGVLRADGSLRLLNRFEDGGRETGAGEGAMAGNRALVGDSGTSSC